MKSEQEALEKEEREWKEKDEEMKKQERLRPLDVDDLTHEGKSKTSINKKVNEERPKNMTEDEQAEYYVGKRRDFSLISMFCFSNRKNSWKKTKIISKNTACSVTTMIRNDFSKNI